MVSTIYTLRHKKPCLKFRESLKVISFVGGESAVQRRDSLKFQATGCKQSSSV